MLYLKASCIYPSLFVWMDPILAEKGPAGNRGQAVGTGDGGGGGGGGWGGGGVVDIRGEGWT